MALHFAIIVLTFSPRVDIVRKRVCVCECVAYCVRSGLRWCGAFGIEGKCLARWICSIVYGETPNDDQAAV